MPIAASVEIRQYVLVMPPASSTRSIARLRLRPLRPNDLDALIKVEGDPATNQHRPAGPPTDDEVVAA